MSASRTGRPGAVVAQCQAVAGGARDRAETGGDAFEASRKLSASGAEASPVIEKAKAGIIQAGYSSVEYLELRAEDDLKPLDRADRKARLLVAAWLGEVRLIDNVEVVGET